MVFSDNIFLFFFLPLVILCTNLCPKAYRNYVLLVFSLIFYAWGEPVYIILMLSVIVLNYLAGLFIDSFPRKIAPGRRKAILVLAVAANLLILGYFKYTGFFAEIISSITGASLRIPEILLPIGISFYIFQSMSYVIDVYRGRAGVQKNIFFFGTYVALFPQLIAGPIVRYSDIERQLTERRETLTMFSTGIRRFVYGLAKKVLLANQMGLLADTLLLKGGGTLSAWAGMAAYTLQIYFDFSGYSDMAIGLGRMLGFRFFENFNYPYISKSITEFWRRWHISLSSWFKEYVYIPLGGNRKGLPRQCLNLLIVWMLTGLWHGASLNFVIWGLYYAVILIIEKLFFGKVLSKMPGIFRHIYALLIVAFGWGIFYYTDFGQFTLFVNRLVTYSADEKDIINWMIAYLPTAAVAVLASTKLYYRFVKSLRKSRFMFLEIPILAVLFVLCVSALVSQSYNPFIYFRF